MSRRESLRRVISNLLETAALSEYSKFSWILTETALEVLRCAALHNQAIVTCEELLVAGLVREFGQTDKLGVATRLQDIATLGEIHSLGAAREVRR